MGYRSTSLTMDYFASVSGKQRLHARPVVPFYHLEGKNVQELFYYLSFMFYGCRNIEERRKGTEF
jgi:hypothetical protein